MICGVSLSPKQRCHFGILCEPCRDPPFEDLECCRHVFWILSLIWEPKAISSAAAFGWAMIDISNPCDGAVNKLIMSA